MKTKESRAVAFVRQAATWPTIREVAQTYGLSERWVRECVQKRRVTALRLDVIRIDPESWEAFLRERYSPADQG